MKKFPKLKSAFILFLVILTTISCLNDDNGGIPRPTENIFELIAADPNLSNLVAALEAADGDLPSILQGTIPYTVMAPTDEAFTTFLDGRELSDIPASTLQQVLLNHVITGELRSAVLLGVGSGFFATNARGPVDDSRISAYFEVASSTITFNGISEVVQPDITASNGTIHKVDAVIGIPNVMDFIITNPDFSDLETALTTATPDTEFDRILRETAFNTILAPTNEAFDALLAGNPDWNTVDDIDESLLAAVVSHHVIGGVNILTSSINGMETFTTLEGDELIFNPNSVDIRITDGSGNTNTAIRLANIQGSNGIIHTIDRVLLPDTTN